MASTAARFGATVAASVVGLAAAAECIKGPLPFALSAAPSAPPPADVQSPQSFCAGLPAHSLGPSIAQKRSGSNYGKLNEEEAMRQLERSLRASTGSSPVLARLLALPSPDGWERTASCLRSAPQDGLRMYAWVSVAEPKWVGDDLSLVVHVCSAADPGHQPAWWRSAAAPRRYAAICTLERCVGSLLATSGRAP